MTCYMRHMGWLFQALGLEQETGIRTRLDAVLREIFGLPVEAGCPVMWATLRALTEEEQRALVPRISELMQGE